MKLPSFKTYYVDDFPAFTLDTKGFEAVVPHPGNEYGYMSTGHSEVYWDGRTVACERVSVSAGDSQREAKRV